MNQRSFLRTTTGRALACLFLLAAVFLIPELYERRNFALAWTDQAKTGEALRAIRNARDDGLDPDDYHLGELERLLNTAGGGQVKRVDLDLLLTDGVIRLGYHLRLGKVDPYDLDPDWNLSRDLGGRDPVEVIGAALDAPSPAPFIAAGISGHFFYRRMKTALARYREIARVGGWPEFFEREQEEDLNAMLTAAEIGSAWSLLFPEYTVVVPQPDVVRIPVAYAMPRGDHELVNFVSSWVELKKSDGTIESLYDHWILGKTAVRKQPRWSVIRDLLHWVE